MEKFREITQPILRNNPVINKKILETKPIQYITHGKTYTVPELNYYDIVESMDLTDCHINMRQSLYSTKINHVIHVINELSKNEQKMFACEFVAKYQAINNLVDAKNIKGIDQYTLAVIITFICLSAATMYNTYIEDISLLPFLHECGEYIDVYDNAIKKIIETYAKDMIVFNKPEPKKVAIAQKEPAKRGVKVEKIIVGGPERPLNNDAALIDDHNVEDEIIE
jgi:hypothetical protein